MPHFFISYRRSDREGRILAHVIFRELRRRYGEQSAFLDVDSRSPGLSFPVKVDRALNVTDVVLVIIGPAWLQILTERLGDSRDWVRYEVAESLKRSGLPVVPICVAGVEIPRSHQLPEELKDLSSRDGAILDPGGEDFESHLVRLLSDLESVLETTRREKEELRREGELRRKDAARLSAEKEAREKAEREEREAKWAAAAELAAQEAARAKAAAAERSTAQAAKVQKKVEPESQKAREAPASRLGPNLLSAAPSRLTSVPGPSAPKSGAPVVVPFRPASPPAASSTVKAPVAPARPVSPSATSSPVKAPAAKYYQDSEYFTVTGVILSFLLSGLMILALAFGYSYSLLSLPFVQVNFVLTLLYGALAGLAIGLALRWCRVHHLGMVLLVGFVAGFGAVYSSWVVWFYGHLGMFETTGLSGLLDLASAPGRLWHLLRGINETGSWDVWGYKPTGGALWLVWGLEAVLITGLSIFFAFSVACWGDVFCQACGTLCKQEFAAKLRICDLEELKQRLEAKDFAFLKGLGAPPSGAIKWLQLDLCQCKKCGNTNTLSTYVTTMTLRLTKELTPAVLGLLITATECAEIQLIGREAAGQ